MRLRGLALAVRHNLHGCGGKISNISYSVLVLCADVDNRRISDRVVCKRGNSHTRKGFWAEMCVKGAIRTPIHRMGVRGVQLSRFTHLIGGGVRLVFRDLSLLGEKFIKIRHIHFENGGYVFV